MEWRRIPVCHDCLAVLRLSKAARCSSPATQQWTARSFGTTPPCEPRPIRRPRSQAARHPQPRQFATHRAPQPPAPYQAPDLNKIHSRIQELSASVLKPDDGKLPAEARVLYVLEQLEHLAKLTLDEKTETNPRPQQKSNTPKETATSALLGSVNARAFPAFISKASILNSVGEKAEEMVRHAHVFITPAILKAYVKLQSLLYQPTSFPDVFDLYARKPIPSLKGREVTLSPASPNQIKSAVPSGAAKAALDSAIEAHNLPLAIDIISTSYCTPAFKKAKTFKQAAFPIVGLGVAPLAAYTLSSTFAHLQQSMDPGTATGIAFAGMMTYVGAVSMVGYVAVTTANDQMDRITWAAGVPLWERWVREEERAAIDRVAGAWGFKDIDKRGEEEGEQWDALKEWVGSRGMVLDKVSLLPGME